MHELRPGRTKCGGRPAVSGFGSESRLQSVADAALQNG